MSTRAVSLIAVIGLIVAIAGFAVPRDTSAPVGSLWASVATNGVESEHFDSMAQMARSADAAVIGRIVSVEPGRVFGQPDKQLDHPEDGQVFMANVKVDVEEVLRGSLEPGWRLEVMAPQGSRQVSDLGLYAQASDRSILFLRDEAAYTSQRGWDPAYVKSAAGLYRLVRQRAVITDDHGVAELPLPDEELLVDVSGRNFETIAAEIRNY